MVDRQKELYHHQLAAQAAWYTQHSGFTPAPGAHPNAGAAPQVHIVIYAIIMHGFPQKYLFFFRIINLPISGF